MARAAAALALLQLPAALGFRAAGGFDPNEGEWVLSNDTKFVPCCGWDDGFFTSGRWCGGREGCGRVCGPTRQNEETWASDDRYLAQVGGHGCSCHNETQPRLRWAPSQYALAEFDAQRFCALLAGRRMLFIGDSTLTQMATELRNAIHYDLATEQLRQDLCHHQVLLGSSDTLVGRNMGVGERGQSWNHWMEKYDPEIVVLSAGPHIKTLPLFREMIEEVARDFEQRYSGKLLMWKSQQPAGCSDGILSYNWHLFPEFDAVARDSWQARRNASLLDLTPLYKIHDRFHPSSKSKAEADRPDCLHLCMPGPLRIAPQLLQQFLESGEVAG